VIDGDTIEVRINNRTEKVRFIGVDTPETVHPTKGEEPYGREASDYTKSQLNDQSVGLEFDVEKRDRYGRLLAYVWLEIRCLMKYY
jgi:micrococcal nuclease